MASLSAQEYLKMQEERTARKNAPRTTQRVGFFKLADDGDSAIVRFAESVNDMKVYTSHAMNVDGKFRKIACLRTDAEPMGKCPICASGNMHQNRIYIKLIEYTRDENGNIVATPKVWERSASFLGILAMHENDYGDLKNMVFKITRLGAKGSMQTTYAVNPANPNVYTNDLYVKDFSSFDGYEILGGPLMNMSFDEMAELAGPAPVEKAVVQPQPTLPQVAQPYESPIKSDTLPYGNQTFTPGYDAIPSYGATSYGGVENITLGAQRRITY